MAVALALATTAPMARANAPSVADLDATARSAGNRRDVAQLIGDAIFKTQWPAEVNQVSANELGRHLIVGVRLWGVKFHHPLMRTEFVGEIVSLTQQIFGASPEVEEIDFWASVPIDVSKDVVVSGDLAKPTSRTVFSLTVRRGQPLQAVREGALGMSDDVFWDAQWVREAFRPST